MHGSFIREVPILSTAWCLCWLNQIKPFQLKTFGQNINSTAPLSLLNWKWLAHFNGFTSQAWGLLWGFNVSPCLALGSLSALLHIPNFSLESAKPGAGLETTMRATNICVFSVSWAAPGHLESPVTTPPDLLELLGAGLSSWFVRYAITHKLMMQLHRGENIARIKHCRWQPSPRFASDLRGWGTPLAKSSRQLPARVQPGFKHENEENLVKSASEGWQIFPTIKLGNQVTDMGIKSKSLPRPSTLPPATSALRGYRDV